jgi:hypothetical protein
LRDGRAALGKIWESGESQDSQACAVTADTQPKAFKYLNQIYTMVQPARYTYVDVG